MHYLPFLKAGSKKSNSTWKRILCSLLFLNIIFPMFGDESGKCEYSVSEDGTLVLSFSPAAIPEKKIKNNIEQGHKSEIFITYRIQQNTGSFILMGAESQELNIRRTGFRDQITGDYVLMLNGRERAVYRDWSRFFRDFSSPLLYPSRIDFIENRKTIVKVRSRIIYKKLVPPFSILYLIPGKFMHRHPWQNAEKREVL